MAKTKENIFFHFFFFLVLVYYYLPVALLLLFEFIAVVFVASGVTDDDVSGYGFDGCLSQMKK